MYLNIQILFINAPDLFEPSFKILHKLFSFPSFCLSGMALSENDYNDCITIPERKKLVFMYIFDNFIYFNREQIL